MEQKVKRISVKNKPAEIRMQDGDEVYFVTVRERTLEIRPSRARAAGSTVFVTIGQVYRRALTVRAQAEKPTRKTRKVSRSLLSTEKRSKL